MPPPATLTLHPIDATLVVLYFVAHKITASKRTATIAVFTAFIVAFVLLTWTGTALRGPNWDFYWPWQEWPTHPIPF